jgi:hypothetical protein
MLVCQYALAYSGDLNIIMHYYDCYFKFCRARVQTQGLAVRALSLNSTPSCSALFSGCHQDQHGAQVSPLLTQALVSFQCIPSAIVGFAVARRNINAVSSALRQPLQTQQPHGNWL